MAIYNTPDGRQVVGSVESGNDYHGFNGKRDIIIQLTADGATADGLNALEYLKAYAVEQNKQGNPIFPNGTRVWISANGFTKAVEADDIVIDGENVTIGGIAWNGSAWDYSKAGQGETGLPAVTPSDAGKVLSVQSVTEKGAVIAAEQTVTFEGDKSVASGTITNVDTSLMTNGSTLLVTIDDTDYVVAYANEPFTCGDYTISKKFGSETELAITCDSGDTVVVSINLATNSGVWVAQMPSSGVLYVEVDNDDNTSHSATEIKNALDAGSAVFAVYKGNIYICYSYDELNDYASFIGLSSTGVGLLVPYDIDNSKQWYSTNVDNRGTTTYYLTASVVALTFSTASDGNMSEYNSRIAQYYKGSRTVIFNATISGETIWSSLTKVTYLSGYTYPRLEVDFGDYIAVCAESNSQTKAFTLIPKDNRFIVTLTPTAQDFSGTMDKTVAEIDAAYKAGRKIVFSVSVENNAFLMDLSNVEVMDDSDYNRYVAYAIISDALILINTGVQQGSGNNYFTNVYTLTPAT